MISIPWLSVLQDQFQSCVRKNNRRRQLQKHSSHTPHFARAVSMHATESLEERMLLTVFTVVNTSDSGEGSLRAAIEAANAESGADEITFADTLDGQTIVLTDELLITDDLTIDALGAEPWRLPITIDAGHHSRIFNIDDNAFSTIDVTISGLNLRNGYADRGGAILSYENLTLSDMAFSENQAAGVGGAISSYRNQLTISNSLFDQNTAGVSGGGIFNSTSRITIYSTSFLGNTSGRNGGGIYTAQDAQATVPARIEDCLFEGNTAASGGGIYNTTMIYLFGSSELSIARTRFQNNTASDSGGGIFNGDSSISISDSSLTENTAARGGAINGSYNGSISLNSSTLSGNIATGNGGGIAYKGSLEIANSTLSGNQAQGSGGAIYQFESYNYYFPVVIEPSLLPISLLPDDGIPLPSSLTSAGSDLDSTSSIGSADAGISLCTSRPVYQASRLRITNSTITGNSAGSSGGGLASLNGIDAQIYNSIVAGNIASSSSQIQGSFGGGFNIIQDSIDGLLDPVLRNNGGPTKTHALLVGSAAIDAGDNQRVTESGLVTDQRGGDYQRNYAGTVDIGAVEYHALNLVVDTLSDADDGDYSSGHLSLREAIKLANQTFDTDQITFSSTLSGGTIMLESELLISSAMHIIGLGQGQLTLDGGDDSRIFRIHDGDGYSAAGVEIRGLSLQHGSADRGGAILNHEDLTLSDVVLSENAASTDGGAIYHAGGQLTVTDSLFSDNVARNNGGGIYNSHQDLIVQETTFYRNVSGAGGGGIYSIFGSRLKHSRPDKIPGPAFPVFRSVYTPIDFFNSGDTEYNVVAIIHSSFLENDAGSGGGVYMTQDDYSNWLWYCDTVTGLGGTAAVTSRQNSDNLSLTGNTIVGCTFSGNTADKGGGLYSHGKLALSGSTFAENMASYGGGIYHSTGSLNIQNSTLSGNHADDHGGGIYQANSLNITPLPSLRNLEDTSRIVPENGLSPFDSSVEPLRADAQFMRNGLTVQDVSDVRFAYIIFDSLKVMNSTITGNVAGISGGGIFTYSTTTITNSIVAGNTAEISAQIQGNYSGKTSIIQDSIDGLLDPVLRDNGGPTWTHALLPGSAALNAGDNAAATDADLTTDQRGAGYARIAEGTVDIGAYEAQGPFTQIEMRFTNSRTRTSVSGEKSRLPENRTWIDQWGNHWLEIWGSTPDSTSNGIQSAEFNLNFNPEVAQAVSIEYGPAFTGNQTETIDNSAGKITGLSATTSRTDVGDDQYVLLARIQFVASDEIQAGEDYADSRERIVNPQFSLSQLHIQLVGGVQSEVIDATTLGSFYQSSRQDDSDSQFFTAPQYDFSQTGLYNLGWGHAVQSVELNSALDLSQLSLIVLPYTQSFLADENTQPMPLNGASQTTGDDSAETRKTDISDPDGENSLLDDYFSGLNDTSRLLTFET